MYLYINKFKNLIRTSKFKFSFRGLIVYIKTKYSNIPSDIYSHRKKKFTLQCTYTDQGKNTTKFT